AGVLLADVFRGHSPPGAIDGAGNYNAPWRKRRGQFRQVRVEQKIWHEVAERMIVVLGIDNALKRNQPTSKIETVDFRFQRRGEQSRDGGEATRGQHQRLSFQVWTCAQPLYYGQQVGNPLPRERLTQDERGP